MWIAIAALGYVALSSIIMIFLRGPTRKSLQLRVRIGTAAEPAQTIRQAHQKQGNSRRMHRVLAVTGPDAGSCDPTGTASALYLCPGDTGRLDSGVNDVLNKLIPEMRQ
jgi:hypothetical protein